MSEACSPYAEDIDPTVSCTRCEAVCCRMTVVLMPEDSIPARLTDRDELGLEVMARGEEGWCVALNLDSMRCTIYERRPTICREFAMGAPDCRQERDAWFGTGGADAPLVQDLGLKPG